MSVTRTTARTRVAIDGREFLLTPGQDLVDFMSRVEGAARAGGTFVHFSAGNLFMSALITPTSRVTISVEITYPGDTPYDFSDERHIDWSRGGE